MVTPADRVVVIIALLLLPYLYITFWGNSSHGEQVTIRVANEEAQSYPLHYNRRITVEGALGSSTIVIHDGQVSFTDSPCNKRLCLLAGRLNSDGESAACLPNGITIQVEGRNARFDAVNF